MKTKTKLLVTLSTKDQVKELLLANGYEARFMVSENHLHHSIDSHKRFVALRYKRHEGYIIVPTSVWIDTVEDAEVFAREAVEAKMLFIQLTKILEGSL